MELPEFNGMLLEQLQGSIFQMATVRVDMSDMSESLQAWVTDPMCQSHTEYKCLLTDFCWPVHQFTPQYCFLSTVSPALVPLVLLPQL